MTVFRHALSVSATPSTVFDALFADHPFPLWFDRHGERGSGVSYLSGGEPISLDNDWSESLRARHRAHAVALGLEVGEAPLGIVLVVPYEAGTQTLGVDLEGPRVPVALEVRDVIEVDHRTGRVTLWALRPEGYDISIWAKTVEEALATALPRAREALPQGRGHRWRDSPERYRDMIEQGVSSIRRGDVYQICVTTQVVLEGSCDPVALHQRMREVNPTHHQALLGLGSFTLVSASPETFLTLTKDRHVFTRPIKGTRPRGHNAEEDRQLAQELLESDKERAENLMIVDLMRNDLSRVCEVGSVMVPELLVVESYASVHQLVSTVSGKVTQECDFVDVLQAAFPAGSMTGAPKRRAVELLGEMESGPRGWYSGCYGVWRADGSAEMAMTIRSAIITDEEITLGVGGGITALSDPDAEIVEVGIKALPFLTAFGEPRVQYS